MSSANNRIMPNNISTVMLRYCGHSNRNRSRRNERAITAADVHYRTYPMLVHSFAAILSILCCILLPCAFASPSPYYSSNYYPSYSNSPRSSYGSPLYPPYSTGASASSFYGGKPSYAYSSPYSGGYAAGISAYEGPAYGMNMYWQPGIAVPPYGGIGYGSSAAALGAYGVGGASPFPYGGMGGAYGDLCRDRSADCAMAASAAQCASAMSLRTLCPQSCGVGCFGGLGSAGVAGADLLYPPSMSPYYVSPAASLSAPNPFNSPFSPYRSAHSSAATTTTAVTSERKEEKEKQQRAAKVLFNEDASNGDEPNNAWTSAGHSAATSIFDQSPSQISSALFNAGGSSASASTLLAPPNWPNHQQLQQHSKVIRMDDLVMDKAKQRKTTKS